MIIQCRDMRTPNRPHIVELIYWDLPIDEKLFRAKRRKANRRPRRGESRNARKARKRNKRFFDNFRPIFGYEDTVIVMPPATGKSVVAQVPFPACRVGVISWPDDLGEPPPYTHMKVKRTDE